MRQRSDPSAAVPVLTILGLALCLASCAPTCVDPVPPTELPDGAGSGTPTTSAAPEPAALFDTSPVPVGNTSSDLDPAWVRGPFMEIFVRAYRDSNGDGDGDLEGVIQSLDYLSDLGIRGIWFMGIFPSWDHDHNYMVTDYRAVDPAYGDLDTFDRLIREAHRRGMGIILDYATNMSATTHPAFQAASSDRTSPWRDWYVWSDFQPLGWSTGLWQKDVWRKTSTGWYYAFFDIQLPEFNWKNPDVARFHQDTFRFWLNRGVDGLRLDSASFLVENGAVEYSGQPETWALLAELRSVVDQYENRFLVCEGGSAEYAIAEICGGAFGFDRATLALPGGGELHGQRAVLAAFGDPDSVDRIARYPLLHPVGKISMLLQNHDSWWGDRLWDQFGGDTPGYRLAAATNLLMPGIPFLYYGEEIGMAQLAGSEYGEEVRRRGPMSWTADPASAGFTSAQPWRAPKDGLYGYFRTAPNATGFNVEAETGDADSLLEYYRSLIALRTGHPALDGGGYRLLKVEGTGCVFERSHGGEAVLVAFQYGDQPASFRLDTLAAGRSYRPLFAYRAAPSPFTASAAGSATILLPPQSVQVFSRPADPDPFGVDMYVRGTMNDWNPSDNSRFEYLGKNRYEARLYLAAGTHAFKIAGEYWEYGFGAVNWRDRRTIRMGVPFTLETTAWDLGNNSDVLYLFTLNGFHIFTLDASNVLAPVLTVRKDESG